MRELLFMLVLGLVSGCGISVDDGAAACATERGVARCECLGAQVNEAAMGFAGDLLRLSQECYRGVAERAEAER